MTDIAIVRLGIGLVLLAAFTAYAVDVLKKLKDMLSTATPGKEEDHEQQ